MIGHNRTYGVHGDHATGCPAPKKQSFIVPSNITEEESKEIPVREKRKYNVKPKPVLKYGNSKREYRGQDYKDNFNGFF